MMLHNSEHVEDRYETAVRELYFTLFGTKPTNYHALLYHLIAKADDHHRALLRVSYPLEVHAWEEWQQSEDEREFFGHYGLKMP